MTGPLGRFTMTLALAVGIAAIAAGCGSKTSGACNICPSAATVNLSACAEEGAKAGCASAQIREVTDDRCDLGQPATTHQECVYTDCETHPDCTAIARY